MDTFDKLQDELLLKFREDYQPKMHNLLKNIRQISEQIAVLMLKKEHMMLAKYPPELEDHRAVAIKRCEELLEHYVDLLAKLTGVNKDF